MLSDFGIVKIMDDDDIVELTGANITIGTAEYMAPEQVFSKNVDLPSGYLFSGNRLL